MGAFENGFGFSMQAWQNAQSAKDRQLERERQAKQDAWQEEQRGRERQEWQEADRTKADIKDATAERQTVQGTETTAGGTRLFSATPENAASMAALMANEAELTGAAPTQMPTTAVTGNMARGHQIGATADGMNKPEAVNDRVVGALMKNGQIERAATMRNTVLDQKAKALGLEVAQLKFADEQFNRTLGEQFANAPDWTRAAAEVLTKTQQGGLAGMTVTATPGKDGKTVDFVGQGADGQTRVLATLENSDAGKAKFLQTVMRAPVETKIGWLVEESKAKQVQANSDREYQLNRDKFNADQKYRGQTLALRSAGGGGGGGSGGIQPGALPDPMAGFDSKKAYAAAVETATAELSQSGQPATPQAIAKRATDIYRGLESEFQNTGMRRVVTQAFERAAATAKTPQEIADVYQRGIQAGLKPAEMAAIDPRFMPAQQAAATSSPGSAAPSSVTPGPMTRTVQQPTKSIEPKDRNEFLQIQDAMRMGYTPAGRGNAMFGAGEVLYINKATGERKYASQLFSK